MKEFLPLVGSKKEIKKYKAFGILLLILILAVSVSSVLGNTIGPWLLGDTSGGGTIDGSTDNSTDNTSNDCDQGAIDTKRAELEAALALLQEQITNAEAEVPDLRADILKDEEALREIENWLSGNAAWIKGLLSEMDLAYDELSRHVADGNTQAASETRSYIAELRSEVSEREEIEADKIEEKNMLEKGLRSTKRLLRDTLERIGLLKDDIEEIKDELAALKDCPK